MFIANYLFKNHQNNILCNIVTSINITITLFLRALSIFTAHTFSFMARQRHFY